MLEKVKGLILSHNIGVIIGSLPLVCTPKNPFPCPLVGLELLRVGSLENMGLLGSGGVVTS